MEVAAGGVVGMNMHEEGVRGVGECDYTGDWAGRR